MLLSLLLVCEAPAGKLEQLMTDLDAAREDPSRPPPPFVFDEAETQRLESGQPIVIYEHAKGHDVAVGATLTWADSWEVWRHIRAIERYPEYLTALEWAKLDAEINRPDHVELQGSLELDLGKLIPGTFLLKGFHYTDRGYMSFHQTQSKDSPFTRLVGYWSVTAYPNDMTLIACIADGTPNWPIPVTQRQWAVESAMPYLVASVARRAEREIKRRAAVLSEAE